MFGLCSWIVVGLIVGAIARALFPGRQPMGWIGTAVLGMAGSLVGGFLSSLLWHGDIAGAASGWAHRLGARGAAAAVDRLESA